MISKYRKMEEKKPISLPENAFTELREGEEYQPVMNPRGEYKEVTTWSLLLGLVLAIIFSAACAYLGLKVGQVFEAAIPITIIAVGLAGATHRKNALGENVIIQSIGACSGMVVAGAIFTLPALYILQAKYPDITVDFMKVFLASLLGGVLGILFLIPFRKFFVKDTGSGIDPQFIGQIFDTYASKDAEQQKGYGLGLALCRIIVEKMEGTISVESTLGKGSTFTFVLPFHGTIGGMATSNRTTTNVRTLRVNSHPDENNMKTILVAEDEESNFELVRIVLQKRYRLLRAHNGIEAVTINEDEHPDLILMDIRMPDMNGLDATRIIKEVNHSTPIIALSAYAFEENVREAKAAGCDEFMAKPFRVEDLIEMCAKYIKD